MRNLKQAKKCIVSLNLINQKSWLKLYNDVSIAKQKKCKKRKKDSKQYLFKLMNNAVFGNSEILNL